MHIRLTASERAIYFTVPVLEYQYLFDPRSDNCLRSRVVVLFRAWGKGGGRGQPQKQEPRVTRCRISLLLVTGLNDVGHLRPFFPKSPKIYCSADSKHRGLGCCGQGRNTKLRIRSKIAGEDARMIPFVNKYHLGLSPHEHQVSFKTGPKEWTRHESRY
ncbi:unnamed protein product [Tuber melanosporum]|uniref:(Perigord truffle) hypothetical protein n=1 Tax=Tuber melanosporum (strain Mel28) TaxID=656061 RepID=D5GBB3_TUBMM|nr:uncharacterized protein GSTUM_00000401001 [Tuber melanosporum]CAZ81806.1 unnamed protein product [Tuber melanosporum]